MSEAMHIKTYRYLLTLYALTCYVYRQRGKAQDKLNPSPRLPPDGVSGSMLTDVSVRKAAPTNRRQEITDGQVPGLVLLVQPTGAKSFAVRYSRAGRVMKVTLGPYPALSLAEARRRALGIAASVANGADPAEEKKAARKAAARVPDAVKTVRTIADEFLKRHTDEKNGARWAAETRRILGPQYLARNRRQARR